MPTPGWARFTIGLFVAGSFVASLLAGALDDGVARYASVGALMSAVVLILLAIERWAWSWPLVRNILRVPNLNGTWKVELESSYEGEGGGSKTSFLVIHQTYSTITVEVLTDRGRSCSEAASLTRRGPRFVLAYVYRAEPESLRRDGNEPHRGAAELLVEIEPTLRFEGDYWTDRKTRGRLRAIGWKAERCGSFGAAKDAVFRPTRGV